MVGASNRPDQKMENWKFNIYSWASCEINLKFGSYYSGVKTLKNLVFTGLTVPFVEFGMTFELYIVLN